MSLFRSYFLKNNTIIEDNRTNNSQNPVTEISYGTLNAIVSRYIFEVDLEPLKEKINNGDINPNQITRHTLKLVNTIRFTPDRVGTMFQDCETQRTASFNLDLFNIDQDWDEGNGYDFVYVDEQFPQLPQQAVNWYDRKTDVPWTNEGAYNSGTTQILGSQQFEKGNEDVEIDVTDYINFRLFSGNTNFTGSTFTGITYGLGLKFPDNLEVLETLKRNAVAFHIKNATSFFEPFIETEYDNSIIDDRNYFYLNKNNNLFLYSKIGGRFQNIIVNSVEILDYEDNVIATVTGDVIQNIRKGIYSISLNIDSNLYPDAVIFTDRWNVIVNGQNKIIDQEFYLISEDNYFNFNGDNILLTDNYFFKFFGIKNGENIRRGLVRKINIDTKEFFKRNQDNNIEFDLQYRLFIKQSDKYEFDVIPWTNVDRTNIGYEFTLDTSWLIPQDYYIELRMIDGNIVDTKENVKFTIVSDGVTGVQNQ